MVGSPMKCFLRLIKLNQYFLHAPKVFKFSACLVMRKINIKCLLASLKTLTNFKDCTESCIKFLFQHSFSLIGEMTIFLNHPLHFCLFFLNYV
jgi:hypothetical protein